MRIESETLVCSTLILGDLVPAHPPTDHKCRAGCTSSEIKNTVDSQTVRLQDPHELSRGHQLSEGGGARTEDNPRIYCGSEPCEAGAQTLTEDDLGESKDK